MYYQDTRQPNQMSQSNHTKIHVPKHEPENEGTRFIVGTYHNAYLCPLLKIQKIIETKCGKYVYLEEDDGETVPSIYRRKVYFKDGYEYYKEDNYNGFMEETNAQEFVDEDEYYKD
jgi:hypothetical protein